VVILIIRTTSGIFSYTICEKNILKKRIAQASNNGKNIIILSANRCAPQIN
jgi:hypothetical protein